MIKRSLYETTADYMRSIKILKGFIEEVLDGDIEKLRTLCFDDLNKYVGDSTDPDMFLITQAIYILLWGDVFNLGFDRMGPWTQFNEFPYRGDTMNSFGSLFGKENLAQERPFAFRARYFGAENHPELWETIKQFDKVYHYIGNFIVLPNRGTYRCGINGARANYYNEDYGEGMRDYFDWFLVKLADYQEEMKKDNPCFSKFQKQLHMNREYSGDYMSMEQWCDRFFLEPYFQDGNPKLLFKTPLEDRLKKTAPVGERGNADEYYSDDEYIALLEDFLNKSMAVIRYRTDRMVDRLKEILANE